MINTNAQIAKSQAEKKIFFAHLPFNSICLALGQCLIP